MKFTIKSLLLALTVVGFTIVALAAPPQSSPGRSEIHLVRNPILPGFHPDPTICRNGDDFYLATSSFEYFPGVTIYRSRDLTHWEAIGHALTNREQLDLTGQPCSGGIYAPTLRFHKGTYYMITTLVATGPRGGNFVVTAKDPAGPWSEPHRIKGAPGIDPSLFFDDDGTAYYCGNRKPEKLLAPNHRIIWIRKLNLNTWELEGPEATLEADTYYASNKIGPPNNFEGPHLYKKDGSYYLMIAHGGTGKDHAVSIWRSSSPMGPWEENPANPILTHRGDRPNGLTCTGHADVIQAADGRWWMVLLGVRNENGKSLMGRETFLTPVDWSGAWPVVNPGPHPGRIDLAIKPPYPESAKPVIHDFREDFDKEALRLEWKTIRTPTETWWDLNKKKGWLSFQVRPDKITDLSQPSFLGIPITEPACQASTKLEFRPVSPGECAGLAILRSSSACWMVVVENQGTGTEAAVYEGTKRLSALPVGPDQPVELRIRSLPPRLFFDCRQAGADWRPILDCDAVTLAGDFHGRFTGTLVGLYASSNGAKSDNSVSFDFFDYSATSKP